MPNRRSVSWTAALRDLKADRATRPDVREERLRSGPHANLSAWRGRSGRRYVVGVHPLVRFYLDDAAVVVAVRRDDRGIASVVSVETFEADGAGSYAPPAGATELHVHRLAKTAAARAAVAGDLQ